MILDRFGEPVPVRVERKALGFVDAALPCDEQETVTGISASGSLPSWREDEDHAGIQYKRKGGPR